MNHAAIVIAAGLALAASLPLASAQAQSARSFVSGQGLDTNACTLAARCRTFAVAFAHTNAGGEIDVLDPAGYGTLTITHAISIVNDGVGTAGIQVPDSSAGITINAGPNDVINLRGLIIDGNRAGNNNGVAFNTGGSLNIQNCVFRNLLRGIRFAPAASSKLFVSSTLISDSGSGLTSFRVDWA
jgi:hypothetical protein